MKFIGCGWEEFIVATEYSHFIDKASVPLKIGGSRAKSLYAATSLTFENFTSYGQKTPGHGMWIR